MTGESVKRNKQPSKDLQQYRTSSKTDMRKEAPTLRHSKKTEAAAGDLRKKQIRHEQTEALKRHPWKTEF
jgi:hypothetical protein